MASKVDICNMALRHCGAGQSISNLEAETSEAALACKLFYDQALGELLDAFPWPFAKKITALALIEDDPNDEWGHSYALPSDCSNPIRILSGVRNDTPESAIRFLIGSDASGVSILYCDLDDAELEYVFFHDDPVRYPPPFVKALAYLLATYLAPSLAKTEIAKRGRLVLDLYNLALSQAQANSLNQQCPDAPPASSYERSRE